VQELEEEEEVEEQEIQEEDAFKEIEEFRGGLVSSVCVN
jgi:hypothetical protein